MSKKVYFKNEEITEKLKRLRTMTLSAARREIIDSFEVWLHQRGFLTDKQYKTLCNIYEKPTGY